MSIHSTYDSSLEHEYLPLWRRGTAQVTDFLIVDALTAVPFVIADHFGAAPNMSEERVAIIYLAVRPFISAAYHAFTVAWLAGTIGHNSAHALVAVANDGSKPSATRAAARAALGLLDLLVIPFIANIAMILCRRDRRHIYDLIAGTVLVSQPKAATATQRTTTASTSSTTPNMPP